MGCTHILITFWAWPTKIHDILICIYYQRPTKHEQLQYLTNIWLYREICVTILIFFIGIFKYQEKFRINVLNLQFFSSFPPQEYSDCGNLTCIFWSNGYLYVHPFIWSSNNEIPILSSPTLVNWCYEQFHNLSAIVASDRLHS